MYNLLLAGNDRAFDGMLINALSYVKYNKKPTRVYILTMDLTEFNPKFKPINKEMIQMLNIIYKKGNPQSEVILKDCRDEFIKRLGGSKSMYTGYTPYTYLRLFIDKSIDEDKILYLDTDTIFNGNIDDLYNMDLLDYEYAGAKDFLGKIFINRNYINAGVLLFNLKRIRETNLFNICLDALKIKKYTFNDQDVLNKFCQKKLFFDSKYNNQYKYSKKTVIQHFSKSIRFLPWFHTVNVKPWMVDQVHEIYKLHAYDDVLDEYEEIVK